MKQEIDKLQIISLIGGRVCNPRQQHVVDIQSILLLPRVTNPPPPIRKINCCLSLKSLFGYYKHSR